jgi:hypothetical protein
MMKTITFARFKRFLESVGLRHERGPSAHEYFTEPDGQALFVLPRYHPNQLVRPPHLVGARRLLIEKGYLEPEDFERFLDQRETA